MIGTSSLVLCVGKRSGSSEDCVLRWWNVAMTALAIKGERESGQDVRTSNVTACVAVANIVKSSLGPMGLEKMLVDEVGDVTVTHDGRTILQLLEVDYPRDENVANIF